MNDFPVPPGSSDFESNKNKIKDIGDEFLIHEDYFSALLVHLKKYFNHSNELSVQDFKKI